MGFISGKLWILTCVFNWLYSTQGLSSFSLSIIFFVFMLSFWFVSSDIIEVLLINPSAKVFVFGKFNVHHKDWLTFCGGTDKFGELCCNFTISDDLTQIFNFPTQIPDCDSRSSALLDLYLLLRQVFVLQWLSPHWEILIMLLSQFLLVFCQTHKGMPHFIA